MNINQVIKYPILSEKTYAQMAKGVYTFAVDPRTNKLEVKNVIEFIFDVKVAKVNIMNYDPKPKRVGRFSGFTNAVKKAVITLAEGQINIFPDEAEGEDKAKAKIEGTEEPVKMTENLEISEAERKAAERIAAKTAAKAKKPTEPAPRVIRQPSKKSEK